MWSLSSSLISKVGIHGGCTFQAFSPFIYSFIDNIITREFVIVIPVVIDRKESFVSFLEAVEITSREPVNQGFEGRCHALPSHTVSDCLLFFFTMYAVKGESSVLF